MAEGAERGAERLLPCERDGATLREGAKGGRGNCWCGDMAPQVGPSKPCLRPKRNGAT